MYRLLIVLFSVTALFLGGCNGNVPQNATNENLTFQGKIEIYHYGDWILHSYTPPREQLPDLSFIIEGKNSVVVLEQPSLPEGIIEFKEYIISLNKPLVKVISSYHTNALSEWEPSLIAMIEGMPEAMKARSNGEEDGLTPANITMIPANSKQTWADVDFQFIPSITGAPSADVIIAGKVYYMHGAPSVSHIGRIRSKEWIDQQLSYYENVKNAGCELIIGSHGVAARSDVIDFQVAYLVKVKEILNTVKSKEAFIAEMKSSFYGLNGEANLTATAENLYE